MKRDSYLKPRFSRRISRRRFIGAGLTGGAALASALVLGCEDEEGQPSTAAPAATTAVAEPKRGGTILAESFSEFPKLDPQRVSNLGASAGHAYSRLIKRKLGEGGLPERYVPEGELAEKWEQPDGATLILNLRRGVKFHNIAPVSGKELIADDVVYSFNRALAEKVNAEQLSGLTKMTVIDRYTLRFDLDGPNADFLLQLADSRNVIVAKEAVEIAGNLDNGPTIGTGAWILDEWQPQQVAKFKANPQYFISGIPYADNLTVIRMFDQELRKAAMITKNIHFWQFTVNKQTADIVRQQQPSVELREARLPSTFYGLLAWLHSSKGPTQDVRVRRAISKAIDRQAFMQAVEGGLAFLYPGVAVLDPSWLLPESELQSSMGLNLNEAKALLTQAGFSSWKPELKVGPKGHFGAQQGGELLAAQLKPLGIDAQGAQQGGELLAAQLKPLGIDATIAIVDGTEMVFKVWGAGEGDMGYGARQPQTTVNAQLVKFYKSDGGQNGFKLNDPQLDEWINKQRTLVNDTEGRKKLIQDIQRRIIEQAVVVPLYATTQPALVQSFLKNFVHDGTSEPTRFDAAWLDL